MIRSNSGMTGFGWGAGTRLDCNQCDVVPEDAAAMSDAFEALVALGFKQGESKRALDGVRGEDGPRGPRDAPAIVKRARHFLRTERAG